MTGWHFHNLKRDMLRLPRKWNSVSAGEVFGKLTVLTPGRGKEWVDAECSCGSISRYTASAIKIGRATRCSACDDRADAKMAWMPPDKWKNPRPKTPQDNEIERVQAEKRRKRAIAKKDRYG